MILLETRRGLDEESVEDDGRGVGQKQTATKQRKHTVGGKYYA